MKLRVIVPNLVGKETVLVNISSSSTVLELKRMLAAKIPGNLGIEDLKLIHLGRLLPDLSLLSYWLLSTPHLDHISTRVEGDICTGLDLLRLKSDSAQHHEEKMSTHTLHLAYPPPLVSPSTLKSTFFIEESSKDALGEQQQAQLSELYNTYLSLYWQSVSQSEGLDLDPRLLNMVSNTAPPPAATGVPPAADSYLPPEAYLEVLWGLLTCLLHSFLIIAILNFYGNLKFVLGFTFACLIFLGQEAMHLDEEEEEPNYAAVPVEDLVDVDHQDDHQEDHQQPGEFAILIANLSLFFSSVFPEGLHLRA